MACCSPRPRLHWTQLADAADDLAAIEALLRGSHEVAKALPDPLTVDGFEAWIDRYVRAVMRAARTGDARAVKAMVAALDRPWAKLSVAKRERLIDQAAKKLALTGAESVKVETAVADSFEALVGAAKKRARGAVSPKVQASFDAIDQAVLDQVRNSQAHFVRDEYGRRQADLSVRARSIVAKGVEAGHDSETIGQVLGEAMTASGLSRAESYWNVVSNIYAARGRAYALVKSYDEAGIEKMKWISVIDEVSTETCRFLDGTVFSTGIALQRYQDVANADDPEDVVALQPFINKGRDEDGGEYLYYRKGGRGGERVKVCDIAEPAYGKKDQVGTYTNAMSGEQLQDAGISTPPIHGL